jgi:dTDP-4-amino-4,6-dideoxygalactose transaminase
MDRDDAVRRLHKAGIGTGVFYPNGVHRFAHIRETAGEFSLPATDRVAASVISLPVHPLLEHADLERIAAAVNSL